MSAVKKIYYWIYMRQSIAKEVAAICTDQTAIEAGIMGASPYQGEGTDYDDPEKWWLMGTMSNGGQKGIAAGAFLKGEKGDTLPLAGGENPVISEKALAEFQSFDVDKNAWATAATGAAAWGTVPIRKAFSTNISGKNVDICFVDARTPYLVTASGDTTEIAFMWDVPCHVGVELIAGEAPKMNVTIERDVSDLNDHIDIFTCTANAA